MSYNDALKKAGYYSLGEPPEPVYEWIAYSKGEVKYFNTDSDARKFSKLVEVHTKNSNEIEEYRNELRRRKNEGIAIFLNDVKNNVAPNMSQELWNLCWDTAYNRKHDEGYGYDSIAAEAEEIVDLIERAIEIYRTN